MPQKNRQQLQVRFKQGLKPNEQDFKDFIESTLNITDDGIERSSGTEPLKIKAYSADENFLDFVGKTHTWRINQKTNTNQTQGLNFATSDGSSRLFIDNNSGNVGISIDEPKAKLHVQQANNEDALRIDDALNDTAPFIINRDGKVGIGTVDPGTNLLKVNTGSVRFELGSNYKLSLGGNGSFEIDAPNIVGGRFIVTDAGKVGINTTNPSEKLEIRMTGGDNQQTNSLSIFNDGVGASQESRIVWKNGTDKKYAAAIASRPGANYNNGDLRFQTAKDGVLKDRMTIDQDGSVSISASTGSTANIDLAGHVQLKEFSTQQVAYLQARDDTSNRNISLRIRTQKQNPNSNKPQLVDALTINPDGIILSNKWNVTTIFDRKAGPLPVTGDFTSSGGSLIIFFGGTGFRTSGGLMSLEMYVDNTLYSYTDTYTNETGSHKAFPTTVRFIGRLAAGNHTLKIAGFSNSIFTDLNDRFYATVIELPF